MSKSILSNEHVEHLRAILSVIADAGYKPKAIALSNEHAQGLLSEIDRLTREELRLCARLQEEREANRTLAAKLRDLGVNVRRKAKS